MVFVCCSAPLSQDIQVLSLLSLHCGLHVREKFNDDYQSLQETLLKLPEKVTHEVMVS